MKCCWWWYCCCYSCYFRLRSDLSPTVTFTFHVYRLLLLRLLFTLFVVHLRSDPRWSVSISLIRSFTLPFVRLPSFLIPIPTLPRLRLFTFRSLFHSFGPTWLHTPLFLTPGLHVHGLHLCTHTSAFPGLRTLHTSLHTFAAWVPYALTGCARLRFLCVRLLIWFWVGYVDFVRFDLLRSLRLRSRLQWTLRWFSRCSLIVDSDFVTVPEFRSSFTILFYHVCSRSFTTRLIWFRLFDSSRSRLFLTFVPRWFRSSRSVTRCSLVVCSFVPHTLFTISFYRSIPHPRLVVRSRSFVHRLIRFHVYTFLRSTSFLVVRLRSHHAVLRYTTFAISQYPHSFDIC